MPGCTKRVPASGCIRPAITLSKVDLPEPLRPTRQMRSPECTVNSTPSNSGWPPKVSIISDRVRIGAGAIRVLSPALGRRSSGMMGAGSNAAIPAALYASVDMSNMTCLQRRVYMLESALSAILVIGQRSSYQHINNGRRRVRCCKMHCAVALKA